MTPIPLVYITGTGRSGSTLLDLLLNAHSEMASCGELQVWPTELAPDRCGRCGCGLPTEECAFWHDVRALADPLDQPKPPIHLFRLPPLRGHLYRRQLVAQLLRSRAGDAPGRDEQVYAENNQQVLDAVAEVWEARSGRRPRWLVDASKDPYRLLWLLRSDRFQLKTIHLVRDVRGYAYATSVKRAHREGAARLRSVAVQSAVWAMRKHLAREVLRRYAAPADHCQISYEDLARDPEATLRRVCSTIGCDFEPGMIERFRDAPVHAISGNVMRFEQRGIELDESWRRILTRSEQALAWSVSRIPPRLLFTGLELRARILGRP
jgi:LPS sulfotransferase NodH